MSLGCTLEYRCINIRIKLSNSIFLSKKPDFFFFDSLDDEILCF